MSGPAHHISGWRRGAARALVVLASIAAFAALLAIWLNRQALNTDNWTKTSSELLEQPAVQARVASRLTDELFASVDVTKAVRDVLPDRFDQFAAPAASALRGQVEKTARKALARPDVQALWADANRTAHEELLAVLEGGGSTVSTHGGNVVLDLKQLLAKLQQQIGVGGRLRKVLPASATQITVLQSDQLATAQNVVKVLKPLPVVLLLVSLGLVAIAMAIAADWRRRAVRAYGIGFIVAGIATLGVRAVAGDAIVTSLASTAAAEPAVQEVWTIGTAMLVDIAVATIIYGVVMVLGAWLAGPTRAAVAVRRSIAPYLREPLIAYSALAIVVACLIWWAPTPAWRNVAMVLILVALLVVGVEVLRRQVIREFPAATRAKAVARHRERWDALVAAGRRRSEAVRASASRTAHSASGAASSARQATVSRFQASESTRLDQLERLSRLREAGLLDDEELRAEKERILHGADELAPH